jgi:hypothetical protein
MPYTKHHGGCTGCNQHPTTCPACVYYAIGHGQAHKARNMPNLNNKVSVDFGPSRGINNNNRRNVR